MGISIHHYSEIELDKREGNFTKPFIGSLYSHEVCFLMRRRSGWTIAMCAEQAGVSRYWFNLMELGKVSPEKLIEYWIENEG